jgi:hypothetical protein
VFFSRVLVLSMVLPQFALGQVAATPRASSSDVEAQLLNRAARAELRGYAIQQEMQTLGEAFAKDPGYRWSAESLHLATTSAAQLKTEEKARIVKVSLLIVGVSTAMGLGRYFFVRGKDGLGASTVLIGVGVAFFALLLGDESGMHKLENQVQTLENFRYSVLANGAQREAFAESISSFFGDMWNLKSTSRRGLRDTLNSEFSRGNFTIDRAMLARSRVITEEQIQIFENLKSDTSAVLAGSSLSNEVSPMELVAASLSHLKELRFEVKVRLNLLADLGTLPRKMGEGITPAQLYVRHVDWLREMDSMIESLESSLNLFAQQ